MWKWIFLLLFIPLLALGQLYHEDVGGGCCGKDHCIKVEARIVSEAEDEKWEIEVNQLRMKVRKSGVRLSNTGDAYWCFQPAYSYEDGYIASTPQANPVRECFEKQIISEECFHCLVIPSGV